MKKIVIVALAIFFAMADSCVYVGAVKGREYNEILRRWIDRNIMLYACPDPKAPYIIQTDSPMTPGVVLTGKDRRKLIKAVDKAKKWADKAKKIKAPQFSKPLFKNSMQITKYGEKVNVLNIDFFTAQKGRQNDLIFHLVSVDNPFKKADVYVDIDTNADRIKEVWGLAQKKYQEARKAKQLAKEFK